MDTHLISLPASVAAAAPHAMRAPKLPAEASSASGVTTLRDHLLAWLDVVALLHHHRTTQHPASFDTPDAAPELPSRTMRRRMLPPVVAARTAALVALDAGAAASFPLTRLTRRLELDPTERDMLLCVLLFALRGEDCTVRDLQQTLAIDALDVEARHRYFSVLAPLFYYDVLLPDAPPTDLFAPGTTVRIDAALQEWLLTGEGPAFDALCRAVLHDREEADAPETSLADWMRYFRARRLLAIQQTASWTEGREHFDACLDHHALDAARLAALHAAIEQRSGTASGSSPLQRLCARHGLGRIERDILLLMLEHTIAGAGVELRHVLVHFAHECGGRDAVLAHLADGAPLVRTGLLSVVEQDCGLRNDVRLPPAVRDELLGLAPAADACYDELLVRDSLFRSEQLLVLEHPAHTLDDLVVTDDIRMVLDAVVRRHDGDACALLASWGFTDAGCDADALTGEAPDAAGAGAGVLRLIFSGAPGTGKTFAARALAGSLGCDLLVTDVSRVISAMVGESEKNIAGVFDAYERVARRSGRSPVLLLNECDQFMQTRGRGDSHPVERMYHQMQNLLLERIERFRGVLVATTNLVHTLDAAFSRRFEYKLVFPRPGEEARLALWRRHLPARMPLAADVELDRLARDYAFSGGQIDAVVRNAALAAALRRDIVCMHDFVVACERESAGSFESPRRPHHPLGFHAEG